LIEGNIIHSTIAYRVNVQSSSVIEDSVVLPDVKIGKNVYIKKAVVNQGVIVPNNYYFKGLEVTLLTQENLLEVGEIK
jgi:glucose-1-phosphate adenylyltransferase